MNTEDENWFYVHFNKEEVEQEKDKPFREKFAERKETSRDNSHFALFCIKGKQGRTYLLPPIIFLEHFDLIRKYQASRNQKPDAAYLENAEMVIGDESDRTHWSSNRNENIKPPGETKFSWR